MTQTSDTVSDERLAELLDIYIGCEPYYSVLTELQRRRASDGAVSVKPYIDALTKIAALRDAEHVGEPLDEALDLADRALSLSSPAESDAQAGLSGTGDEDLASDDRWNAGVNYAIERLCELVNVNPKKVSWDAATETLDGDVRAVLGDVMVKAYGEEWCGRERETQIIRAALASPKPEEPPVVSEEMAVLPRVETVEMCEAGLEALRESLGHSAVISRDAALCYRAMVSAALQHKGGEE